jgi:hypothetical protein
MEDHMLELAIQFAALPSIWRFGFAHTQIPTENGLPAADAYAFWLFFIGIQVTLFYPATYQ